jgi:hypothetical protein
MKNNILRKDNKYYQPVKQKDQNSNGNIKHLKNLIN